MKGKPAVVRSKTKLSKALLTSKDKLVARTELTLKLEDLPPTSDRSSLLRTRRIEQLPLIEVSADVNRLRKDCFARSVKLAPKDMHSGIKKQLLRQYERRMSQIITIQRFWRRCMNRKELAKHLRRIVEQGKRKLRRLQHQSELKLAKQLQSQKWKRAAELLEKGRAGSLTLPLVIDQIHKMFDAASKVHNPEQQSPTDSPTNEHHKQISQQKGKQVANRLQSNQQVEFKLYATELQTAPSSDPSPGVAIVDQLYEQLIEDFCRELSATSSLFKRMFVWDTTTRSDTDIKTNKFQWDQIKHCCALFFSFIRKFYLKEFMFKFSEPFGLSPLLALKSIRGDLTEAELQYNNHKHQLMTDQMLLKLSEFIFQRLYKENYSSPKSVENRLEMKIEEDMEQTTNVNLLLTAIIEILGGLKPFGNPGKPPLELQERFPTRTFDEVMKAAFYGLQQYDAVSKIDDPAVHFQAHNALYLLEVEKDWKDTSSYSFEAAYIAALDITEYLFWEAFDELCWCFQPESTP